MSQLTDLQWDSLVDAIRQRKCILFIGPDATINFGDPNRQRDFLRDLAAQNPASILAYHASDGFLVYDEEGSKDQFYPVLRKFYKEPRPNPMLDKLAQVPWHVAITVTPDLAVNEAFNRQGLHYSHEFYVTKTQQPLKALPTQDRPLVYHLLGCVERDESLITSHLDLFATVHSIFADKNLPEELVSMLGTGETRNVVFLGFQFDKWYYHLVLYLLQLKSNHKGRLAASVIAPSDLDQLVLKAHYKINFISGDLKAFIDELHGRFEDRELRKPQPIAAVSKRFLKANILRMLQNALDPVAFESLCFVHFADVHREFAPGQTQSQRITMLMSYCERTGSWEVLLEACAVANSHAFKTWGPYYEQ